jgi:WhiB family transcriptional regulator, redox-sensing transcriptional regulator
MTWVTDWPSQAACTATEPDDLFVEAAAQNRVNAVCFGCPVRTECVAYALDNRAEFVRHLGWHDGTSAPSCAASASIREVMRALLESARVEYEVSHPDVEPAGAPACSPSHGGTSNAAQTRPRCSSP